MSNTLLSTPTAQLALGYSQVLRQFAGIISPIDAKEETKQATRQYARRQETWFYRDERIQWISPHEPGFDLILEKLSHRAPSAIA